MLVYQKVNHLPMQGMQLQALEGVLYPSGPRSEVLTRQSWPWRLPKAQLTLRQRPTHRQMSPSRRRKRSTGVEKMELQNISKHQLKSININQFIQGSGSSIKGRDKLLR